MENLSDQLHKDLSLRAKLHGFKMKAPVRIQRWTREDDDRMKNLAKRRFEQMEAEAEIKSKS